METVVEYCQRHEPRLRLSGIAEDEIINHDSRMHSRRQAVITLTAILVLIRPILRLGRRARHYYGAEQQHKSQE